MTRRAITLYGSAATGRSLAERLGMSQIFVETIKEEYLDTSHVAKLEPIE